jgi:uncharacterized RDD family membrane protein YckC
VSTSSSGAAVGTIPPSRYPGERLGLPEHGRGSVARVGRRIAAIAIDWAIATVISYAFFSHGSWAELNSWATTIVFVMMQVLFIPTIGGGIGHRLLGLRVVPLRVGAGPIGSARSGWVGVWRPVVRSVLLAVVVPALVWDSDQRGFHDKVAGTVLIRA